MPINMFRARTTVDMRLWLQRSALAFAVSTAMVAGISVTTMNNAHAAVTTADFSDLVQQVTPAVARVNVTKTISEAELAKVQTAEVLRQFFGDRVRIPDRAATPAIENAYGTGFFITSERSSLPTKVASSSVLSFSVTVILSAPSMT